MHYALCNVCMYSPLEQYQHMHLVNNKLNLNQFNTFLELNLTVNSIALLWINDSQDVLSDVL